MKTTLSKIKAHAPCQNGWEKLLSYLGKTGADDEELSILTIIESNGIEDALWALRAVEGHDREIRLFAVWCARQVQHLMADHRSLAALDVAERFANGQATEDEMLAARDAAYVAHTAAYAAGVEQPYAAYVAYAASSDPYAAAYAAAHAAVYAAVHVSGVTSDAREAQKQELIRICRETEK